MESLTKKASFEHSFGSEYVDEDRIFCPPVEILLLFFSVSQGLLHKARKLQHSTWETS